MEIAAEVSPDDPRASGRAVATQGGIMVDTQGPSSTTLLDQLANLDPEARRELPTNLRQVSATFREVPDGKTTSHVLGVLARLLDPS